VPRTQIPIGESLYLWRDLVRPSDKLVITAHGAGTSDTLPPNLESEPVLHFFVPDGSTLSMSISEAITRIPLESHGPWFRTSYYNTPNYPLSKYTNSSSSAVPGWNRHNREGESYQTVRTLDADFDIVTIRNRYGSPDAVTLAFVINTLAVAGYRYREVSCLFCRGDNN